MSATKFVSSTRISPPSSRARASQSTLERLQRISSGSRESRFVFFLCYLVLGIRALRRKWGEGTRMPAADCLLMFGCVSAARVACEEIRSAHRYKDLGWGWRGSRKWSGFCSNPRIGRDHDLRERHLPSTYDDRRQRHPCCWTAWEWDAGTFSSPVTLHPRLK